MATATLVQFIALNDQLAALAKADIPVHLGLPSHLQAADALEQLSAIVARRVGEGATVDEALNDRSLPPAYRSVTQLALQGGDLATALAGASRMAETQDESWYALRMSLRYPLLVCCLAYLGIVLFCLFLVPTLESMYEGMRLAPGWGLSAVIMLRTTLPYWVAIPPFGLALLLLWTRWTSRHPQAAGGAARVLAWLPGMSRIAGEHRSARFADSLAGFLDAQVPLPQSLRKAAAAWESDALERGTLALADAFEEGPAPSDNTPFAAALPPLLRWAIWHSEETVGRTRALRMAAVAYRESVTRRIHRLRTFAPVVTCFVLGGGIVLLYALALFVPVAQMLQGLAG